LQKDRADRYQSAAEVLIDLETVQRGNLLAVPINEYLNIRYAALAAMVLLAVVVGTFIYRAWKRPEHTLAVMSINCEEGVDPDPCSVINKGLQRTLLRRTGLRVATSDKFAGMFRANTATPERAALDSDADIVMFGRLARGEPDMVLTIIVQRVRDGQRLFEKSYPVKSGNLSLLGQRITLETAFQLQLPTDEDDQTLLELIAANDNRTPQAYNLYLQGRKKWSLRDHDSLKEAIDDFLKATELDPAYAEAYAGIADCYVLLSTPANGSLALPIKEAIAKADWAAKQALKYGDQLAESHNAYGSVLWKGDWDWEGAEKEFKKAIALDPDYEPAHLNYSQMLSVAGRNQEAVKESELAMNQDPFSGAAVMNNCRTLYAARQFDQADACLNKLAVDLPNYMGGKYLHGIVYNAQGRYAEATQIFEEIYARDRAYGGALLGYTYGIAGRRADAERVLNEMREYQHDHYLADQELAIIYMGMGDLDDAFPLFRKAVEDGFPPSQAIFFSPSFDRLRADPRFAELAKHAKQPLFVPAGGSPSSTALR
jgi:tetratricopeptide (TPR) repeat protein